MPNFVFITGPVGRELQVDSDGRLICNANATTSGYIFGYGETGHPLCVDGCGQLLINASGVGNKYVESIASGAWVESGVLYYNDVEHNLSTSDVIADFYNISNNESIGIDKHVIIDDNTLRVWVNTSGLQIKVVVMG